MQRIPLPDDRVAIVGAIDIERTADGFIPRRLPHKYRHQYPMEVDILTNSPSGVRLAFVTDSNTIGLEVLGTHLQLGTQDVLPATLDLFVDRVEHQVIPFSDGNRIVVDAATRAFDFQAGEVATVTFENVPSGLVEIWLPSGSFVEARALHLDDGASLSAAPQDSRRKWVHHGSSISHCLEAQGGSRAWPAVAARIGDVNVTNLGLGGQCHLDQFTARTMRDMPADLLSLKVGINVVNGDTLRLRTFASALHGFIDTIRDGHPDVPFIVASPIICPAREDNAGPSDALNGTCIALGTEVTQAQGALTLRQIRKIVADVVRARVANGDTNLHYMNGLELFNEADVDDLPDGLHPNGAGYIRMGERFAAIAFADDGVFAG